MAKRGKQKKSVRSGKPGPKPRNYKAEYARRIASAAKKGKTRQAARGHKPKEHIARAEREKEEYGITTSQMKLVRDWCARYKNESRDCEDVVEEAKANGYEWFVKYRETWNAARRQYLKELKAHKWISRGLGYLHMLAEKAEVDDSKWLYYH